MRQHIGIMLVFLRTFVSVGPVDFDVSFKLQLFLI